MIGWQRTARVTIGVPPTRPLSLPEVTPVPRHRLPLLAVLMLLLAACTGGGETSSTDGIDLEGGAEEVGADTSSPSDSGAATTAPDVTDDTADMPEDTTDAMTGGMADDPAAAEGDVPREAGTTLVEARDGTWRLGEAGEVEFTATGGRLDLVEVRPEPGWDVIEREVDDDEIEVDLRRGEVTWQLEVELDDGLLEIEVDENIRGAQPGTFAIGDAGEVTFTDDDGRLTLVDVTAAEGWEVIVDDDGGDEIEVDLVRDGARWDVEIERDDGRIDVDIHLTVRGPAPA